jgi:hypothetical protein
VLLIGREQVALRDGGFQLMQAWLKLVMHGPGEEFGGHQGEEGQQKPCRMSGLGQERRDLECGALPVVLGPCNGTLDVWFEKRKQYGGIESREREVGTCSSQREGSMSSGRGAPLHKRAQAGPGELPAAQQAGPWPVKPCDCPDK